MSRVSGVYFTEHFHEAVEKGDIRSYYQPIYRTVTGKIICAESLARWIDPELGVIPPAEFIPVLEENDLIYELDMEILRQTCAFYTELKRQGSGLHSFTVNLSRQDFERDGLFAQVVDTLDRYAVPHSAIKLEITESLMIEDEEKLGRLFRKFREAGFSVWLDDFGSGYSSLNVLQNYDFDVMKFDMLFLRNNSQKSRHLLGSLISMAKTLGIHTLTEGVETKEQRDFLLSVGCEALQGFYYAKPLTQAELMCALDKAPGCAEDAEDKRYWDEIGHLNVLSQNPLEEFSGRESREEPEEGYFGRWGNSIALLECSRNRAHYVYANANYLKRIEELGYTSIEELERRFNDHRSSRYLMLKKLVTDAIAQGTIKVVEYSSNDVYYRLSAKCLARRENRAMLALRLSTFETENEEKAAREMIDYGNALFSTFEIVVLIYMDQKKVNRIYSSSSLPLYDREKTMGTSLEKFCEREVEPEDQERYLRFMNFGNMTERVEASSKKFIQGYFRMRWRHEGGNWYVARVTRLPILSETTFMLTIQSINGDMNRWLDIMAAEHPELL